MEHRGFTTQRHSSPTCAHSTSRHISLRTLQLGGYALIYFRCADIALTVGELTRRGVAFKHKPHLIAKMDDHDLWMAFFTDPDGHTLAVMQEAPKGYMPPQT